MATSGMFSLPSISGSDEVHERVCSLCSEEDKDVVAVELCLDCEQFLCRSCSVQHGRFKSLQKHKVVQKDQVPNLSLSVLIGSEEAGFECTVCTIYGQYTAARVYCIHCCKYLCSVCENNHNQFGLLRNHKVKTVEEIRTEVSKSNNEDCQYVAIVEKPIRQEKLSCASCKREIEDTQLLWKCIHCGFRNTCQDCCGLHQTSNLGHRLIPFKEFKVIYQQYGKSVMSGSGEFMGPVCSKCCEEGLAKYPLMFCTECNMFVCISCKKDHTLHRTESEDVLEKAIADEIVQMENIEHDCSICLDRNLRSSAAGYCLKCDVFICVGCTIKHAIYFVQESHQIRKLREINLRKEVFFKKTLYSTKEIIIDRCDNCSQKGIIIGAAWRCLYCQKSLCMSCLDFHEKSNVGHSLTIVRTKEEKIGKCDSEETQKYLQSPIEKAVKSYEGSSKLLWMTIDLGALRSGFTGVGLGFIHELKCGNFENILSCQFGNEESITIPKSCLLFDADHRLCYFGTKAMTKYKDFKTEGEADCWHFFDQYDKCLRNENLTDKTELFSANGNSMNAGDVFGALTVYLTNYALNSLPLYLDRANSIRLVYLVSDTVSTTCQSMLKSAAEKAGIDKNNVSFVSKATSIITYSEVQSLLQDKMICQLPDDFWKPGYKFLAADLASDQVTVSVHERLEDGTCRTIDKFLGEWGFQKCVSECIEVFPLLFGHDVCKEFLDENPMWLDEMTHKVAITWRTKSEEKFKNEITLDIPPMLFDLSGKKTGKDIRREIQELLPLLKMKIKGHKLRFESSFLKTVVENCISENTSLIKMILSKYRISEVNTIIFFGTVLENNKIKDAMIGNFDGAVIISNNDSGHVLLKAAILHDFTKHVENCPFTYGINICRVFHDEEHACEYHLSMVSNDDICRNLFRRFFIKGEKVNVGQHRVLRYRSIFPYQGKMLMYILRSDRREPIYADENGVEELGVISVNLGSDVKYGEIEVRMMFREMCSLKLLVEAFTVHDGTDDKKETLSKVYSKMFSYK